MIFQDPATYLNPVSTVASQLLEAVSGRRRADRLARAKELLGLVGLEQDLARRRTYPHELSGGMKQRVLIAMALAGNPKLLIADEPTTALDVTVQAQILDLLKTLRRKFGMGLLLITHDLGVVRHTCDRAYVMHRGETIETAATEDLFRNPRHQYTSALIASTADTMRVDSTESAAVAEGELPGAASTPVVDTRHLTKLFPLPKARPFKPAGQLRASQDVSLQVAQGESVALIGESGSGKTTIGRILLGLTAPTSGTVAVAGQDVTRLRGRAMQGFRRNVQMIFQNPYSSLNPIRTVGYTLCQPFLTHGVCSRKEAQARARELLSLVELPAEYVSRYPHQLSGGERQRVAIARAMSLGPKFVVADEPVSALDMAIRGQVLRLMKRFHRSDGVSYLLITHDLSDASKLTDRVVVLYLGRVMEQGPTDAVLDSPRHPYTRSLISATLPVGISPADRKHQIILRGDIPSAADPPSGCVFRTRCPYAEAMCADEVPQLRDAGPGRQVACLRMEAINQPEAAA
jgi:oligopeptide/dipeptide ABC transporter ATP-binding protein